MRIPILFFIFFCISVNIVTAQQSMVSDVSYSYLDTLITLAKKNYPQMHIVEHQVKMAKVDVHKTEVGWLDAFSVSYFYIPGDKNALNPNNTYFFNGYQFGINLNIGTLLQKPYTTKEAKEQYKIAQFKKQEYDLNIENEVKKRYFTYIQQVALLKLRTKSTSDASDMVKQLKYKFERGETSFQEYNGSMMVETEQIQYKIMAESNTFIAKAALEEIIGEKLENIH